MKKIKWSDKYILGISTIDAQHKELIEIISLLQDSFHTCLDKVSTNKIFDQLEEFAHEHFSLEESIMQSVNFPFLDGHKRDHAFFTKMIGDWRVDNKLECKSKKLSVFLTEWLFEHILHHDVKLRDHIQKERPDLLQ